jgi:hypothetical protein
VYYHAVNLAFLSLVTKEDKMAMEEYAGAALEAATKSPVNCWQAATIAEANMYLGNFAEAKNYYTQAAAMAGVREKLSIYANAFMGYTSLKASDTEDDFIKLLKEKLLK